MINTRDRLRNETRIIHERLHEHAGFQPLLNLSISRAGYIELLTRLLGYHRGLEAAFDGFVPDNIELVGFCRLRSAKLQDDLTSLDQSKAQIDASATMATLFVINTDAALLGSLYVREGALIGGRSLSRHLDHLLGQSAAGRSFFVGAPEDACIWRGLCIALNLITDEREQDQAIQAAHATFALFEAWMDGLNAMEPMECEGVMA
jgi:heme oxygenase (biliverdin-IX-beta and delta-forming)